MNEPFQLVTNCAFKGKDYLVQMCVFSSKKLELTVTDKLMAEDWQCEYDASYIEALTHKTGNFKNFEVFVLMLKSGLLKTSDCITLDLLTLEDLEELRSKKKIINSHHGSRMLYAGNLNKRYLILTYSVEFDRIHYPLPLDYCGPPDPSILQSNIRRLEAEVQRLKQKNSCSNLSRSDFAETRKLKEKIERLLEDNNFLSTEVRRLNKVLSKTAKPIRNNQILQNTLKKLEEQVLQEKNHFHHMIWKLKEENKQLKLQIEELKTSEKCLKLRLKNASKYSGPKGPRRIPDSVGLDYLDRRNIRGERSESQLTCRAISSWNSTVLAKPIETKNIMRRSKTKIRGRSSSESGIDKSEKIDLTDTKTLSTSKLKSVARGSMKLASSRKSSGERSRHSSCERATNVQTESIRPIIRKSRPCRERRVSSNGSDSHTGRHSRESSLSSRASSKNSRASHYSTHGSGDHKTYKRKKSSKVILPDRDVSNSDIPKTRQTSMGYEISEDHSGHCPGSKQDLAKAPKVANSLKCCWEELKFSVSDLETRIHALQKILSEGLNF